MIWHLLLYDKSHDRSNSSRNQIIWLFCSSKCHFCPHAACCEFVQMGSTLIWSNSGIVCWFVFWWLVLDSLRKKSCSSGHNLPTTTLMYVINQFCWSGWTKRGHRAKTWSSETREGRGGGWTKTLLMDRRSLRSRTVDTTADASATGIQMQISPVLAWVWGESSKHDGNGSLLVLL